MFRCDLLNPSSNARPAHFARRVRGTIYQRLRPVSDVGSPAASILRGRATRGRRPRKRMRSRDRRRVCSYVADPARKREGGPGSRRERRRGGPRRRSVSANENPGLERGVCLRRSAPPPPLRCIALVARAVRPAGHSSPPSRLRRPRTGGKRFRPVACATCVDARPSGSLRCVSVCACVFVRPVWDGGGVGIRVLKSSSPSSASSSLWLSFSGALHADLVWKAGGQTDGPTDRQTQSNLRKFR
ncbi:hypothetical protein HPB51_007674 [Rhipicephalus microplus]|uniref:Uncharacterized protein n=1 Tax=Rhipicephalus microplus TaxID=6941 RepID=A0A9J6DTZ5_RHIMP|nr:hypothetical protein HPB51_007674 [Rhipicephalus microplus]